MPNKSEERTEEVVCENCIKLKIQLGLTQNVLRTAIVKIRELEEFINNNAQCQFLDMTTGEGVSTEN